MHKSQPVYLGFRAIYTLNINPKYETLIYVAQAEALNQPGVLKGRSLVFSAPTSAGKSAVAEVLMLRRLCEPRTADKIALLVLPFVSLCQEKEAHLARLLKPLEKCVRDAIHLA